MPRKKNTGVDYWLENCFRCSNTLLTHYTHDGKDDGAVSFRCAASDCEVEPWRIDGCESFYFGAPQESWVDVKKSENNSQKPIDK